MKLALSNATVPDNKTNASSRYSNIITKLPYEIQKDPAKA